MKMDTMPLTNVDKEQSAVGTQLRYIGKSERLMQISRSNKVPTNEASQANGVRFNE